MDIKIKKLHHDAIVPQYQSEGAACFDLHSLNSGRVAPTATFDTGVAFEIPDGHVMLVFSRSGHGFKHDVRLSNNVGVIDSDFRNSVKVKLRDDSQVGFDVKEGDRIAQAMVIPVDRVSFTVVDELSETVRGLNGIGSTGS